MELLLMDEDVNEQYDNIKYFESNFYGYITDKTFLQATILMCKDKIRKFQKNTDFHINTRIRYGKLLEYATLEISKEGYLLDDDFFTTSKNESVEKPDIKMEIDGDYLVFEFFS